MSGPAHLLTLGCSLWAMAASACPFCGVVGRPLAQRRDEAAVVAVAEAAGEAAPDADGLPRQTFRIDQLLRGAGLAADALVTARVAGPVPGTAILFGAPAAGDRSRARAIALAVSRAAEYGLFRPFGTEVLDFLL